MNTMSVDLKKPASDDHKKMLSVSLSQEQQEKVCDMSNYFTYIKQQYILSKGCNNP